MEEEVEVFDFCDLKKEQSSTQIISSLNQRLQDGFKVSIMVRKLFQLPVPSLKKNNFFSKTNNFITPEVYNISDSFSSQHTNENEKRKDNAVTATSLQNQTPEVQSINPIMKEVSCQVTPKADQQPQIVFRDQMTEYTPRNSNPLIDTVPQLTVEEENQQNLRNRLQKQLTRLTLVSVKSLKQDSIKTPQATLRKMESLVNIPQDIPIQTQNQPSMADLMQPQSPNSSDSDSNQINTRDDRFYQLLRTMPLYQKIQSGLLYQQDGHLQLAADHVQKAYQEAMEVVGKSQLDNLQIKLNTHIAVQGICYYAQILRCQGKYEESNKEYERCLKLFEINDFDVLGKIYQECGLNSIHLGRYIKALDYYQKALVAYEKIKWKLDIAIVLNNIAMIYSIMGANEDAKKMCFEALAIFKSKLVGSDIRIAETYHTLGFIMYQMKDFEGAMDFLKQSLESKQKEFGDRHISMVKTYNLMGVIQHLTDEPGHAIEYYEQAVWIYGGDNQLGLSQVLNNLGLAYLERFKLKSAKLSFDKAHEIIHEHFDQQHLAYRRLVQNKILVQRTLTKN